MRCLVRAGGTDQSGFKDTAEAAGESWEAGADSLHPAPLLLLRQRGGYLLPLPHFPAGRQGNELLSGIQYITF